MNESALLSPNPQGSSNHRVLVIEDQPAFAGALSMLLRRMGCESDIAPTISEGMAMLDGHCCLLLDLYLPDGEGTTVLKHIRDNHLPMKVAIITESTDRALLARVVRLRPDALFNKQVEIDELLAWLESVWADATPVRHA